MKKLLVSVALLPAFVATAQAQDGTLRLLTLNIWNKFKANPEYARDFFVNGNWDVLLFQEENSSNYVNNIPGILAGAGLGTYVGSRNSSSGIISRLPGGTYTYSNTGVGGGAQGRQFTFALANAEGGRPTTAIASVHLDSGDQPTQRVNEVNKLTAWAQAQRGPVIVGGDFNAGDVSERGLHRKSQQEMLLRLYTKNPTNSFYYSLLTQYATDRGALDAFIAQYNRGGSAVDSAPVPTGLFRDETTPVAGNTPRTMNMLKRNFILLQSEDERERFAPHELNDGSGTWPSAGEDRTNTWGSWDRVKIDHFLASRPYGKWFKIVDDPTDPYLGVIKDVMATTPNGQIPLSDHEPVAHEFAWVGPKLEAYVDNGVNKTRLVWNADANTFADDGKVFYLSRNNARTDVYLGQVSDNQGNPTLTFLTDAEKKTLLDCSSTDPRFQQAIVDYCIDDHGFIGETLVSDGGTIIVDEDAALGSSSARIRLDDGGLRIAGTDMTSIARDVVIEGAGGFLEIADANGAVSATGVFSGAGNLEKRGSGRLNLTGTNTYTGTTTVSAGLLSVNGSIATSRLTTIAAGGTIGGTGTVGNLKIEDGGILAPGNSIGTLKVDGDLTLDQGATFRIEADSQGNSDKVEVSGVANVAGTVVTVAAGGAWKADNSYDILTAAGGVNGAFDRIETDLSFLAPTLALQDGRWILSLDRNDTAFDNVATTANRRSVAAAIDTLGAGNAIYDAIVLSNSDMANDAFRDLAGEIHASSLGGLVENAMGLNTLLTNRMSGVVDIGADVAEAGAGSFWLKAYGGWGTSSGTGVSTADRGTAGTILGYDGEFADGYMLGVFAGFGKTNVSLSDSDARLAADTYNIGAYGSADLGDFTLSLGAAYTLNDGESRRSVAYADTRETLTADYSTDVFQVFGEASYDLSTDFGTFTPFLGLAHVRASGRGFVERGGNAALSSNGDLVQTSFATLGLRAEKSMDLKGLNTTFRGEIGWRHAFGDIDPAADLAIGASQFVATGAPIAVDSALVSASIDFELAPQSVFSLGYTGQFASSNANQSVSASLKVSF